MAYRLMSCVLVTYYPGEYMHAAGICQMPVGWCWTNSPRPGSHPTPARRTPAITSRPHVRIQTGRASARIQYMLFSRFSRKTVDRGGFFP
ncbi:hypothetical protein RSAG8_09658, partial [Rhizoctonia solani AG-8 WAC10335]